ncbi:hypothetical protein JW707_03810 [Candidatus Woesearchaeota archaeon]|nr:hypothetical protein [Candidatus Woesearchaeota archaeon]
MGLTSKKEEQLKKMPRIETQIFKSKSGKLLVHKTVITDIKPVDYYKVVVDGPVSEEDIQEMAV